MSTTFWAPWRLENDKEIAKKLGLGEVGEELTDLLSPEKLDIMRNFSLYTTDKGKQDKNNTSVSAV